MGWFDNALSSATGGLVGGSGGSSALSGVIGNNVSSAIHDVSSGLQTAGALAGDYFTGGASSLLNPVLSKGAQSNLNSPIGKVAQIGSSLYGDYVGGGMTGAPLPSQSAAPIADASFSYSGTGAANPNMLNGMVNSGDIGAGVGGANSAGVVGSTDGTTGMTWNPSTGNFEPTSTTTATGNLAGGSAAGGGVPGASTGLFSGMNTAQKVALGLSGANTVAQLLGAGQKKINTDPYGVGAAASTTATSMLQKFNSGQLMPSDQAGIAQYQDQATAAARDYYQKAGLADSSMAQQAIAQVGAQADQMRQAALNNMYNQAMTAAGISGNYAQAAVQQAVSQNQQLMTAQSSFTNLMMQYGMGTGGQAVTNGTGATP